MALTDSRRLTGPNVYFNQPAAALEALAMDVSDSQLALWQKHIEHISSALNWPAPMVYVKSHAKGATLAFTAPPDQLYCATEINEWSWSAVCGDDSQFAPAFPCIEDIASAIQCFRKVASAEAEPLLFEFIANAEAKGWPVLLDEDTVSIGFAAQSTSWPRQPFLDLPALPKSDVRHIPIAMVTGSNGKTTSVRLLSAMARAAGFASGHNCTDGLFFNGLLVEADDYSGPAGARATLRHPGVEAAILETARGGMLRRGLATNQANAALITNISEDHFGEYGVFNLDDLARVKLTVAKGLRPDGRLVLNAGDPMLVKHGDGLHDNTAWFAADWNCLQLQSQLAQGLTVCAVDNGHLSLHADAIVHDLGSVEAMPLSLNGVARYNIENLAGAALCAYVLGFGIDAIKSTLANFGSENADNPGRLQRWTLNDVRVLLDYAHNPQGMSGFLAIAQALRGQGRMAVLLGQAGNRENDDIVKLAECVADFHPELIVLKDMVGYERGREPGEVPALLRSALTMQGISDETVVTELNELEAVRQILQWAKPGDVLALPVHGLLEREAVHRLLDDMAATNWRASDSVPEWSLPSESDTVGNGLT
jgi:cyanophycin synthetase